MFQAKRSVQEQKAYRGKADSWVLELPHGHTTVGSLFSDSLLVGVANPAVEY